MAGRSWLGWLVTTPAQMQALNPLLVMLLIPFNNLVLYPALRRLEDRGWVSARWGVSDTNRRARFYTLTRAGRGQLVRESTKWRRLAAAMARVLGPEPGQG